LGSIRNLPIRAAPGSETIATVHRLVATRLERHFRRLSALAARGLEHLATAASSAATATGPAGVVSAAATAAGSALHLTRGSAFGATVRFVLEAFARKELLFARTKNELAVAINAAQGFVSIHSRVFPGRLIEFRPRL
jgi:alcohol dehydrogenase class IV